MNLQIEKFNLIQRLINIQDFDLINQIKDVLNKSQKDNIQRMDIDTFYAKIAEAEQSYDEGRYITQQEIKEEIKTWKKK